jgi:hypothetical protein
VAASVCAYGNASAQKHCQGGDGQETRCSLVLDVTQRLGLFAVGRIRFARGTARYPTWREPERRALVGSRTGARRRRFSLSVAPRFLWECLTSRIVRWFPAPASSNPACRFPALGFPVCFTSRILWPMRAGWLSADGSRDSVLVKQSECVIEPLRTPPLPAESLAPSGAHQVPPNLLLHPELNVGKAPT